MDYNEIEEFYLTKVYTPTIVLAGYFGLRRGEICGLRWSDIDFDRRKKSSNSQKMLMPDVYNDNDYICVYTDGREVQPKWKPLEDNFADETFVDEVKEIYKRIEDTTDINEIARAIRDEIRHSYGKKLFVKSFDECREFARKVMER